MKLRDLLLEGAPSDLETMPMRDLVKLAGKAEATLRRTLKKEIKAGKGKLLDSIGCSDCQELEDAEFKLHQSIKKKTKVGRMSPLDEKFRPYHIELINMVK